MIGECAQGDDQRRVQAVNHSANATETPLQAAHRQWRGDMVGALVEAGADVGGIFNGKLTPLAVCIAYGQVESVRALLRAGHDAMEQIKWDPVNGRDDAFSTPAHFCLAPPPLGLPSDRVVDDFRRQDMMRIGAPQIGCLELVLREGSAEDVDAQDSYGNAPILWLARFGSSYDDEEEKAARDLLVSAGARTSGVFSDDGFLPLMMAATFNNTRFVRFLIEEAGAPVYERSPSGGHTALHLCHGTADDLAALLLDAGATVEPRADDGCTPLLMFFHRASTLTTRLMLDRGASVDVIAKDGCTPFVRACEYSYWLRDEDRWPLLQEILRRSSAKTRRSQWESDSAVDKLADVFNQTDPPSEEDDPRVQKRCCWAMAELLASGAPVLPKNAAPVLPIAASLSADEHARLAARRAELCSWRAHQSFVSLSQAVKELREAEREAEQKRARVASLERELEAGSGTDGSSDENSSSISGKGDDDDGENSSEGEGEGETEDDTESKNKVGGGGTAGGEG